MQSAKLQEQKAERKRRLRQPRQNRENRMVFIAVSVGDGLGRNLQGYWSRLSDRGRSDHEPSTEDMVNAIEHVNADTVYILPNNKNIILAAEQAKYLVRTSRSLLFRQDRATGYYCADQLHSGPDSGGKSETMVRRWAVSRPVRSPTQFAIP